MARKKATPEAEVVNEATANVETTEVVNKEETPIVEKPETAPIEEAADTTVAQEEVGEPDMAGPEVYEGELAIAVPAVDEVEDGDTDANDEAEDIETPEEAKEEDENPKFDPYVPEDEPDVPEEEPAKEIVEEPAEECENTLVGEIRKSRRECKRELNRFDKENIAKIKEALLAAKGKKVNPFEKLAAKKDEGEKDKNVPDRVAEVREARRARLEEMLKKKGEKTERKPFKFNLGEMMNSDEAKERMKRIAEKYAAMKAKKAAENEDAEKSVSHREVVEKVVREEVSEFFDEKPAAKDQKSALDKKREMYRRLNKAKMDFNE